VAACYAQWPDATWASAGRPGPVGKMARDAISWRAHRARSRRGHHAHAGGPMSANQRHGAVSGLAGATGRTSGKEEGVGAHQKGGSTVRR
jgi:hypothetical protein